ncbi:EAL domain-containing protein [Glutamicibacter sp. V16R2B1]|uniref:putative bifunctional diguanylate cyclase/phosphodiesterase n=1 Tax=unclassified Glutamicibacter TaxID=2627139 RepID=UPI0010FE4241|nr:EAL domain-containing protein [Glutamicibacter sp. V16R2B1]TLK48759.1 EAL domain-containing protein [Glutamicibacter sp. V16R2B1]
MTHAEMDPRIQDIVDSILKIAGGDFAVSLRPSQQRDDIDAIMVGIKAMANRLSGTYEELEQRVRQRTHLLESARDKMEVLAYTDPLTSLANRAALMRELASQLDAAHRAEPVSTLFLIDLDDFKPINDIHGHNAGDRVLQEVATRLRQSVRPGDLATRLGGDEFAILARVDASAAKTMGQRLLQVLREPVEVGPANITPGGSIGFCVGHESLTAEQWLECADTAMYVAKRDPKEKVQQFEDFMLYERHRKALLSTELRTALASGQIHPAYQTVISVEDGAEVGVEALARWEHPELGELSPADFLPLAAESGLLSQLTTRLLDCALADLGQWRRGQRVSEDFRVQVNVTPSELTDLAFSDKVTQKLREHEIPPECLVIEVTEERYISGDRPELYSLRALRELGVRVFIDDFGAGYSSFGYLSKLPVAGVKVDRSITIGVDSDPKQRAVMQAVLDLAVACGLECIVEGVETEAEAAVLRTLGAHCLQGFLFGRPGPYPSI